MLSVFVIFLLLVSASLWIGFTARFYLRQVGDQGVPQWLAVTLYGVPISYVVVAEAFTIITAASNHRIDMLTQLLPAIATSHALLLGIGHTFLLIKLRRDLVRFVSQTANAAAALGGGRFPLQPSHIATASQPNQPMPGAASSNLMASRDALSEGAGGGETGGGGGGGGAMIALTVRPAAALPASTGDVASGGGSTPSLKAAHRQPLIRPLQHLPW